MKRIKPSPSSMAAQKARELQAEGRDIVSLTTGEPDFDTPEHIIEAAYQAMKRGETRYTGTGGTAEVKAAIAAKFERENGLIYKPSEIMVSSGGKQVIFNAIMATAQQGDEVLIPAPHWVSYPDIALLAGATPISLPCTQESGFKLTPDQLEKAITPRTRWLILNSPCNPSGAVYSADELAALCEVLLRHPQVMVLTDDMYEHIVFDGRKAATPATVCPELKDRTLTMNGVSKAYAMTGWRIGYCGAPAWLISEMVKLQSQSTSNPCSISQAATVAALNGPQDFLAERTASFQRRRDLVVAGLNRIDGIECAVPEGAFYVYPSCAGLIGRRTPDGKTLETDRDVGLYFLEAAGVAIVHGEAFGLSPYFRISFATSDAALEESCQRLRRACDALVR
jgi:aspartate aminotransferase